MEKIILVIISNIDSRYVTALKAILETTFDRGVEKLLDSGEIDDRIKLPGDLAARHAKDGTVQIHIFATGQLGVEPGADLQQAANAAIEIDDAAGRLGDAA